MSSTSFQGLQTCLQPWASEWNILMHKSSPPKSNIVLSFCFMEEKEEKIAHHEKNTCIGNGEKMHENCGKLGGWSFIQSLSNNSNNTKQDTTQAVEVYIHPLVKNNSSTISSISLEMCTENLGSETGSDISDNCDEFSSMLMETDNYFDTHQSKPRERARKEFSRKVEFPPPLTSISGADGVHVVSPHREGARLVLEAITIPHCNPYFQAERVDGRLRLSFLKDDEEEDDINKEETDGLVEEEHEFIEEEKCNCKDNNYDGKEDDGLTKDGMKRKNDGKQGCEIVAGVLRRLSKCKEGGNTKGMTNYWESYYSAIS